MVAVLTDGDGIDSIGEVVWRHVRLCDRESGHYVTAGSHTNQNQIAVDVRIRRRLINGAYTFWSGTPL